MANLYAVWIPGIGEVLKTDDTIADARSWAKCGFPDRTCTVVRWHTAKYCPVCERTPCGGTGSIAHQLSK